MPVTLSIENAPDEIVEGLRRRAARHNKPLQDELMAILREAVRSESAADPVALLAEIRRLGLSRTSEAAQIVREFRDNR